MNRWTTFYLGILTGAILVGAAAGPDRPVLTNLAIIIALAAFAGAGCTWDAHQASIKEKKQ